MKIIRFLILALLLMCQSFSLGQSSRNLSNSNQTDDPIGLKDVPVVFAVYQNSPNPFNPITNIGFSLPEQTNFSLKVFDITGRLVFSINDSKPAGNYNIIFDGSGLASGIYFYSLQTNKYFVTKKMMLVK